MPKNRENTRWEGVLYKPGDEAGVVALVQEDIKSRKTKTIFNEALWRWKYRNNYAGFYPNWICLAGSELYNGIVGHYAAIPVYIVIDKHELLCAQSVDTLTRKECRGQGIFIGLAKQCYEQLGGSGVHMVYGYPNESSYPGFIDKLGWSNVFRVEDMVYFLNLEKISGLKFKSRLLRTLGKYFLLAKSRYFATHNKKRPGNYDIKEGANFTAEHAEMATLLRNRYRCFVNRSLAYLTWRYSKDPIDKEVTVRSFYGRSELKGFYVLKITRDPLRANLAIGHIMELLSPPEDRDVSNYMLFDVLNICRLKEVDLIHAYTHRTQHDYGVLRSFGFTKSAETHYIIKVISGTGNERMIFDEKNWYISLGDSDHA